MNLREKWLILLVVQTVMFGMGTQMSLKDFAGIAKSPRGVAVAQYTHPLCRPLVAHPLVPVYLVLAGVSVGRPRRSSLRAALC